LDRTDQEYEDFRWHRSRRYEICADKQETEKRNGTRLYLATIEDYMIVEWVLGFSNDFRLEISFLSGEDGKETVSYNSALRPLNTMTPEELKTMNYYCRRFVRYHPPIPNCK
jgi:hypothetical protein